MSTYVEESVTTDDFTPRDELYLPGVLLTGQQLDALEAAKDQTERRIDMAFILGHHPTHTPIHSPAA
jgi:hypothetical protein